VTEMAHQIAARTLGATVSIATIRDPADGSIRYAPEFHSGLTRWLSKHRFPDINQAEAGALILADFLGAEYRA